MFCACCTRTYSRSVVFEPGKYVRGHVDFTAATTQAAAQQVSSTRVRNMYVHCIRRCCCCCYCYECSCIAAQITPPRIHTTAGTSMCISIHCCTSNNSSSGMILMHTVPAHCVPDAAWLHGIYTRTSTAAVFVRDRCPVSLENLTMKI